MSYEVSDFNKEVIEASQIRPVLVDFWAPWCGPCRTLSPVLEKLAAEAGDSWTLVTINSDNHQDLSTQYGVRGIPAVKLFSHGEIVAEFTGAMPEYAVRQWLDQQMPSEEKESLVQAKKLIADGDIEQAVATLETLSTLPEANLLLASLVVFAEPERGLRLVANAEVEDPSGRLLKHGIVVVAEALTANLDELPDGDGRELYRDALQMLQKHDIKSAIEGLMQILLKDRYYGDDAARKLGVALFTLLGERHEITKALRRTFDMYLY